MQAKPIGRWLALTATLLVGAREVRADVITPDSIANPPGSVSSDNRTSVPLSNLVTRQYTGLGLNFSGAAITYLDGVKVWAPVPPQAFPDHIVAGVSMPPPSWQILYNGSWPGANFVVPGTLKPTTVSSLSLEIVGRPVTVDVYNSQFQLLGSALPGGVGPHGGQLYTFSHSAIGAFGVSAPVIDPPPFAAVPNMAINPAWGVAQVSFSATPEPSSLLLAGLGALGLAGRFGWRARRGRAKEL